MLSTVTIDYELILSKSSSSV